VFDHHVGNVLDLLVGREAPAAAQAFTAAADHAAVAALPRVDDAVTVFGAEGTPHLRPAPPAGRPFRALRLFFGIQGDVQVEEELLQAAGVLDLDLQIADRVDHLVLVVLHLEADEETAGAPEVRALQGHLDVARQLAAAIASGASGAAGG